MRKYDYYKQSNLNVHKKKKTQLNFYKQKIMVMTKNLMDGLKIALHKTEETVNDLKNSTKKGGKPRLGWLSGLSTSL